MWLGACYGMAVSSNYKVYGEKYYKDDEFLSSIGSYGNIFNGLSRFTMGFLLDNFNWKVCHAGLLLVQIIANIGIVTL